MPKPTPLEPGTRRSFFVLGPVLLSLTMLSACSGLLGGDQVSRTAATPTPPAGAQPADTDSGDGSDLFAEDAPKMVTVESPAKTRGEMVVPDFCRGKAAGLRARDDGFLLAVRMEGPIPPMESPPSLPFGVVLLMHEFHLGVFAPSVDEELGGGYAHFRQYQLPDRPANRKNDLGSGDDEVLRVTDVDVQGSEIRIAAPSFGAQSDRVSEWGVRVTCVLRHPVDGIYFPATRIPLGEFGRLPLG
jgi:hypothetical protein